MIQLNMSEETARIVSTACEFYARVRLGQFSEIMFSCMQDGSEENFYNRRQLAEHYLFEARKYLMPELHGIGHSYGIGKFEDADRAYDVYQVVRKLFGDTREPFTLLDELPTAKRVEG